MNTDRIRKLNNFAVKKGLIVYWMQRDQRVRDNWALIYSQQLSKKLNTPLVVIFFLRPDLTTHFGTERMFNFMIKGLEKVENDLAKNNISFNLLLGDPVTEIERFVKENNVGVVVTDFSPLKTPRSWKDKLSRKLRVSLIEVDAHNIVPVWVASDKQEFAAYTIRPKINKLLPTFLEDFPEITRQDIPSKVTKRINWNRIKKLIKIDPSVPEVRIFKPGEDEADKVLQGFIKYKLQDYLGGRNDPNRHLQSDLSPYLHFGQISSQRVSLEIGKSTSSIKSKESFLEELIIRKELSDNFCYYNPKYKSFDGFPDWARKSLNLHINDKRAHLYSIKDLEYGETDDLLWNAAQTEMIKTGKMHGYLRMYWAKKILEWSENPQEALSKAIYLNDKYSLDGRDPNGYTGIGWSIGGVHDRAWFERPIFGKVRYMSLNGAKSKFNIQTYISFVNKL